MAKRLYLRYGVINVQMKAREEEALLSPIK